MEYPVTLGSSFHDSGNGRPLCVLRYDFQPASVSRTKPGVFQLSEGNKVRSYCPGLCYSLADVAGVFLFLAQVSLYLANNNTGDVNNLDVSFSGKYEAGKDDLDALMIFDGTGFRLEQLSGQIKTR